MKGFMATLQTKLAGLTNDVSISSPAGLDILQYVTSTGKWTNRPPIGSELNNTPVAGANDTVLNTTNRYYTYFAMPSTAPAYIVTGFEWLNGTVVNGGVMCHLERVNANPPTSNNRTTLAWTALSTQTGVSQVQRQSVVSSLLIPAGSIVGASIVSNSATGRFGTSTVAAFANLSAIVLATAVAMGSSTTISNGTEEPYIKVYYKPVMGV